MAGARAALLLHQAVMGEEEMEPAAFESSVGLPGVARLLPKIEICFCFDEGIFVWGLVLET